MTSVPQKPYVIVGTAGHVDHGKTSLVKALTGCDTDRLPEEKRRNLSIDLGFAWCDAGETRLAFVDVPGHERFIANMIAGTAGVDVTLLCIAANEGIQRQTQEHLSALRLLGVRQLVVALTKVDAASSDELNDLHEVVKSWLDDEGFTIVPIVNVSAQQNVGLDELLCTLSDAASKHVASPASASSVTRFPIDRVFHRAGIGTVCTGTIWGGCISAGDALEAFPLGETVRVRGLQVHEVEANSAKAGQRCAIAVSGDVANQLARGVELITPNVFPQDNAFLVELEWLSSNSHPLKHSSEVHLHVATSQCTAHVLLPVQELVPGSRNVAILKTDKPLLYQFGQQGLLRRPAPVGTCGGVRFLGTRIAGMKTSVLYEFAEKLATSNRPQRLLAWIEAVPSRTLNWPQMEVEIGIPELNCKELMSELQAAGKICCIGSHVLSERTYSAVRQRVMDHVDEAGRSAEKSWSSIDQLVSRVSKIARGDISRHIISKLVEEKVLLQKQNEVFPAHLLTQLPDKQQQLFDKLLTACLDTRTPPTIDELAAEINCRPASLLPLAKLSEQQGQLTPVARGLYVDANILNELRSELVALLNQEGSATVAQIRDTWNVTRKHAIPYLEYFDGTGLTVREGNARRLKNN